jgi:type IV pili sensor histidine kinase/response regulator
MKRRLPPAIGAAMIVTLLAACTGVNAGPRVAPEASLSSPAGTVSATTLAPSSTSSEASSSSATPGSESPATEPDNAAPQNPNGVPGVPTNEDDVAAAGPSNQAAQIKVTKAEQWQAPAGSSLRAELQRWADSARWTVVYETTIDYPLLADLRFQGRFDQVVGEFVRLYEQSDRPLVVDISVSQRLVHVTERQRR